MTIPQEVAQEKDKGVIPKAVTELPQELEDPEGRPYLISFSKYNDKACEISSLSSNKARKAIETLKIIGTKIRCVADFQRKYIDRIPVRREGGYLELYNKLPDEIDLKEIKLQQDARIFYFDIEPEKMFYVVAITENHLETDKVRHH